MLDFVPFGQDMLCRALISGLLTQNKPVPDRILAKLCFISGHFIGNGTQIVAFSK